MKLKALSWNIWWFGYFDKISKFLKEFDADIIALQEVTQDDKTRDTVGFLTDLGYSYAFAPFMKIKDGRTVGNAIFSKNEIVHTQIFELSEKDMRNAVMADVEVEGNTLHVFSTHILHPHLKPSDLQTLQAQNLINVVPKEKSVVMGDFNATPDTPAIQIMREALIDTDPDDIPTWSVYEDGCHVCKPKGLDTRFDYIFVSKDLSTEDFQVHQSKGSDHLPISVMLEI